MKKPTLYYLLLSAWALLIMVFAYDLLRPLVRAYFLEDRFTTILVAISTMFVLYFWLNGLKDIVYTLYFWLRRPKATHSQGFNGLPPLVDLVYCTYNDFSEDALYKSMQQNYLNIRTVILDDSNDPEYIKRIDAFAKEHDVLVVRRKDHRGHKAGNLNNYLKTTKAPYFVILDSDEIIPADFITRSLAYFNNPKIGIVQANHIATHNSNKFMTAFADGVESHWHTYQSIKNRYGFLSFLGHGAMIRTKAYHAVGGFPEVVAEDLCFSIELRNKGYFVVFAPEIICQEQYPISYLAFKKRHAKWTMGNMEFIKRYTGKLLGSNMSWYEKLDIVLFTYNLPLAVIFILYLGINLVAFPLLDYEINYSLEMIVPTIAFLLAPLLNDVIYYFNKRRKVVIGVYLVSSILLYGSMFYISFKSALLGLFGVAQFIVTPKIATQVKMLQAINHNREDLAFATGLSVTAQILVGSLLPVALIAIPTFASIYLTMMSNKSIAYAETNL